MQKVSYLGHASFLVSTRSGHRILLDPWIRGNPACHHQVDNFWDVDLILVSHGAFDHLGDTAEILRHSSATAICCPAVRQHLLRQGIDGNRVQAAVYGFLIERLGVGIKVVEARHASIFLSGDELLTGVPLGFILSFAGGQKLYFAGDTALFGDLKLYGELYRPTIGLIPVGAAEGFYAEMPPEEAALATQWLGLQVAIPMHYGINRSEAEKFADLVRAVAPQTRVVILEPGQSLEG